MGSGTTLTIWLESRDHKYLDVHNAFDIVDDAHDVSDIDNIGTVDIGCSYDNICVGYEDNDDPNTPWEAINQSWSSYVHGNPSSEVHGEVHLLIHSVYPKANRSPQLPP